MTFRFNKITFEHIRSMSLSSEKQLDLWQCEFSSQIFQEFLNILPTLFITSLDIGASNLNNKQFQELFSLLNNPISSPKGLKTLSLSRNIFSSAIQTLGDFIGSPHCILEELDLRDCELTNNQLDYLCKGLTQNIKNQHSINFLNLRKNRIQTSGAVRLANLLDDSYQYIKVDLSLNSVNDFVLQRFEEKKFCRGVEKVSREIFDRSCGQYLVPQKLPDFKKSQLDLEYEKFVQSKGNSRESGYSNQTQNDKIQHKYLPKPKFKNYDDDSFFNNLNMEDVVNPNKEIIKDNIKRQDLFYNYERQNSYIGQNQIEKDTNFNQQEIKDSSLLKTQQVVNLNNFKIQSPQSILMKSPQITLKQIQSPVQDKFNSYSNSILQPEIKTNLDQNQFSIFNISENVENEIKIVQAQYQDSRKRAQVQTALKQQSKPNYQQNVILHPDSPVVRTNVINQITRVKKVQQKNDQQQVKPIQNEDFDQLKQFDQNIQVNNFQQQLSKPKLQFAKITHCNIEQLTQQNEQSIDDKLDFSEILNMLGNIPELYYKLKPSKQVAIIIQKLRQILDKQDELTDAREGALILQETFSEMHQTLVKQGLSIKPIENHEDISAIQNYVIGLAIEMFTTIQTLISGQKEAEQLQ